MMIRIHKDSHIDHAIPQDLQDYILHEYSHRDGFFFDTRRYPNAFPMIPCALHERVPESEVFYGKRGSRDYLSRLCHRPPVMTRMITIIAGPWDGAMTLFTMYGGPRAPREPGDPALAKATPAERSAALRFWERAALSAEMFEVRR